MQRNFRLIRELNSTNVEIYKLMEYQNDNTLCYFMLLDTNRKAGLDDFPHLKGIITEEDVTGDNFIKAIVVAPKELDETLNEQLCGIIEELTFHLIAPSLDWNYELNVVSEKEFKKLNQTRDYMLTYFDEILKKEGFDFSISLVKEQEYNHLSQSLDKRS